MGFWKYYYFILIIILIYVFFIHASLKQIIASGAVIVFGFIVYLLTEIQKKRKRPSD